MPAHRAQNLLQYFHLFLVAGIGSRHGTEAANAGTTEEADVP